MATASPWRSTGVNSFSKGRIIGEGSFGQVYEGFYNGEKVAIKEFKTGVVRAHDMKKEADVMEALSHPRLLQLLTVRTNPRTGNIQLVTEFMQFGDLGNFLRGHTHLGLRSLICIAAQVAEGMAYLESKRCIHRDLAARNVLVNGLDDVRIADFGLARFTTKSNEAFIESLKEECTYSYEGTPTAICPILWTAPEAIMTKRFTFESDVWSFGILLYEIITFGELPYGDELYKRWMPLQDLLDAIQYDGYRMDCPDGCPARLYQLMRRCWDETPSYRPSFDDLEDTLSSTSFLESLSPETRIVQQSTSTATATRSESGGGWLAAAAVGAVAAVGTGLLLSMVLDKNDKRNSK